MISKQLQLATVLAAIAFVEESQAIEQEKQKMSSMIQIRNKKNATNNGTAAVQCINELLHMMSCNLFKTEPKVPNQTDPINQNAQIQQAAIDQKIKEKISALIKNSTREDAVAAIGKLAKSSSIKEGLQKELDKKIKEDAAANGTTDPVIQQAAVEDKANQQKKIEEDQAAVTLAEEQAANGTDNNDKVDKEAQKLTEEQKQKEIEDAKLAITKLCNELNLSTTDSKCDTTKIMGDNVIEKLGDMLNELTKLKKANANPQGNRISFTSIFNYAQKIFGFNEKSLRQQIEALLDNPLLKKSDQQQSNDERNKVLLSNDDEEGLKTLLKDLQEQVKEAADLVAYTNWLSQTKFPDNPENKKIYNNNQKKKHIETMITKMMTQKNLKFDDVETLIGDLEKGDMQDILQAKYEETAERAIRGMLKTSKDEDIEAAINKLKLPRSNQLSKEWILAQLQTLGEKSGIFTINADLGALQNELKRFQAKKQADVVAKKQDVVAKQQKEKEKKLAVVEKAKADKENKEKLAVEKAKAVKENKEKNEKATKQ